MEEILSGRSGEFDAAAKTSDEGWQLEDENAKLKKLLAEQMLDVAAMRELLSKKW